jgi:transposase-like protein
VDVLRDAEARHRLIRTMIRSRICESVLEMVYELFQDEVQQLSGEAYSRKDPQRCHRGGSEPTSIYLEGQKINLRRPRLRKRGREIVLNNYKALRNFDLMSQELLPLMIRGIATRDYADAVREIAEGTKLSRSTLSRAFIRASQKDLDAINGRNLASYTWIAIFLDAIIFGGVYLIVALGVTQTGEKVVLGLWEGASENARACGELLSSLRDRGLQVERRILVVLDGSKALKKAVEE